MACLCLCLCLCLSSVSPTESPLGWGPCFVLCYLISIAYFQLQRLVREAFPSTHLRAAGSNGVDQQPRRRFEPHGRADGRRGRGRQKRRAALWDGSLALRGDPCQDGDVSLLFKRLSFLVGPVLHRWGVLRQGALQSLALNLSISDDNAHNVCQLRGAMAEQIWS